MTLKKYHQKRDFKRTPEPYGKKKANIKDLYLVQKHAASHLHYDFRLQIDGVLKSWAVPKGPSLDPNVKRLAVHVEDHPLEYGSFEGIIPEGEYGGGTVMLWDKGEWQPQEADAEKAYEKGNITFLLKGKKLKGLWKLVRIKSDPKNWLLIKINDKYARPEKIYNVTEAEPASVVSHRSLDEISQKAENVWNSDREKKIKKTNCLDKTKSKSKKKILDLADAHKSKMPSAIFPQLATLVDKPPIGEEWLHEIKLDGYRLITFIEQGYVRLMTRRQQNWTDKFITIVNAVKALKLPNAILDGEIVALDKNQHSDFQLLQNFLNERVTSSLVYYVFDLLYYDGYNLCASPLWERKQFLQQLIDSNNDTIRYNDHVEGNGEAVFKKACKLSLEGIVSKNKNSSYLQKRSHNWLKIKCTKRQEFVICGLTKPEGKRSYFGALLLGIYKRKKLVYCGRVGTGFTEESLKTLAKLLGHYKTTQMPFTKRPPDSKHVTWIEPHLVAEIEFADWTREGILRQASFKGLRSDKPAKQITKETAEMTSTTKTRKKISAKFALTNPDRILYPEQGITKLQLAEYYEKVQDWILPYIIERPLTLLRCPTGNRHECFYQKHLNESMPNNIYAIPIKEKKKTEDYIYIKNFSGLLALVQLGVLEIHPWGSRIDSLEKPDIITFDLDPGPDVSWKKVIAAAFYVKELLEQIGLQSFVKTTGGKGLHIILPIKRLYLWDEIKAFTHTLVEYIVEQRPEEFIGTMTKAKRHGKIFLDYLRNQRGATAVAAYSTRAKDHATVATPISWKELTTRIKSETFNIKNVPKRLAELKKDPWADFFSLRQSLKLKKK